MKTLMIKMHRGHSGGSWMGDVGGRTVSACGCDVDALFYGLTKELKCVFEITNVEPDSGSYHTFTWRPNNEWYRTTGLKKGSKTYAIPNGTSWTIMNFFMSRDQKYKRIYVSVY